MESGDMLQMALACGSLAVLTGLSKAGMASDASLAPGASKHVRENVRHCLSPKGIV
jgi:hypothetical protein